MSMWGGRFQGEMSETTRAFTSDIADRRLLDVDLIGSIAHVEMLGETGLIAREEAETLLEGLQQIRADGLEFTETDEDVHSAVERRLGELVGEVAGKLHTGRSRNDQVATDLRLYLRSAAASQIEMLTGWIATLVRLAETHRSDVMPSYTHLQQAQATSLGNHLLAYAWMAVRDAERFRHCRERLSASPLGAGASAGSSLPLDRQSTAESLGFGEPMPNSLDAVGSRDFVSEYVFCCAQTMIHLSRLAEELILWASTEFSALILDDRVSTGSSALPHKRNPDIAELVRGRAATVIGDVSAILVLQKALPLAYNRDLQEDKGIVFHAHDETLNALEAMTHLVSNSTFQPEPPQSGTLALPLAERLVLRGVPFREAHEVVGDLVLKLEESGRTLDDLSAEDLVSHDPRFDLVDVPIDAAITDIDEQLIELRDWISGQSNL